MINSPACELRGFLHRCRDKAPTWLNLRSASTVAPTAAAADALLQNWSEPGKKGALLFPSLPVSLSVCTVCCARPFKCPLKPNRARLPLRNCCVAQPKHKGDGRQTVNRSAEALSLSLPVSVSLTLSLSVSVSLYHSHMHISHAPTFCLVLEKKSFCRVPLYSAFKWPYIQQLFESQCKHQTHARVATLKCEDSHLSGCNEHPPAPTSPVRHLSSWPVIIEEPRLYTQPPVAPPIDHWRLRRTDTWNYMFLISGPLNRCIFHCYYYYFFKEHMFNETKRWMILLKEGNTHQTQRNPVEGLLQIRMSFVWFDESYWPRRCCCCVTCCRCAPWPVSWRILWTCLCLLTPLWNSDRQWDWRGGKNPVIICCFE